MAVPNAALADVAQLVGSEDVQIRVIDAGEMLVIASIADKSARPGVLQIIQRHFLGAAVKFSAAQQFYSLAAQLRERGFRSTAMWPISSP